MERTLYEYILCKLTALSDEEIMELDFEAGIRTINESPIDPHEKQRLVALMLKIQKELPIQHYGVKGMKWGVRKRREAKKRTRGSIYGTEQTFRVKTRSGDVISVEPIKYWSTAKRILLSLMNIHENKEIGRRGDANYDLKNSRGEKIGELSLINKKLDTAYIDWITVDPKQRGKGYATDILNDILKKAKESGYSRVELNALKEPRPLYERIGFTYMSVSEMGIMDSIAGFEIGCKRMSYDLSNLKPDDSRSKRR